jgi:phage FluMu protein Com
MVDWFRCKNCKAVLALLHGSDKKCPSCGSSNGEVVSQEHIKEGFKAGTYVNTWNPRTPKKPR